MFISLVWNTTHNISSVKHCFDHAFSTCFEMVRFHLFRFIQIFSDLFVFSIRTRIKVYILPLSIESIWLIIWLTTVTRKIKLYITTGLHTRRILVVAVIELRTDRGRELYNRGKLEVTNYSHRFQSLINVAK